MIRTNTAITLFMAAAACGPIPTAYVQFGDNPEMTTAAATGIQRWRVGMTATANSGPCKGLYGTLPVPTNWPEQKVRTVEENISTAIAKVDYRVLDNGVRQMLISVPSLPAGSTANAVMVFEVERTEILPPEVTEDLHLPKKLPRDVRKHLAASPYIEVRHAKIKKLAKELVDETLTPWQQIEKIYDHVRAVVEYKNGPLKGAVAALEDGHGDCEELTSLFIALCRAQGFPARTVWVPSHCYPEFYLVDANDEGHWYPCQAAGDRDFGGMPDLRPILQKGDNFQVPEKKGRQRYVAEFLTGTGGKPQVKFIRELLP